MIGKYAHIFVMVISPVCYFFFMYFLRVFFAVFAWIWCTYYCLYLFQDDFTFIYVCVCVSGYCCYCSLELVRNDRMKVFNQSCMVVYFRFMFYKMRFGVWVWYSKVSIIHLDDEYQQLPISCWRPHLSPKVVSNKFDSKALNTLKYVLSTGHSAFSSGQGHQAYW